MERMDQINGHGVALLVLVDKCCREALPPELKLKLSLVLMDQLRVSLLHPAHVRVQISRSKLGFEMRSMGLWEAAT
jgi:hypothetical protein